MALSCGACGNIIPEYGGNIESYKCCPLCGELQPQKNLILDQCHVCNLKFNRGDFVKYKYCPICTTIIPRIVPSKPTLLT